MNERIFTTEMRRGEQNTRPSFLPFSFFLLTFLLSAVQLHAQDTIPVPGPPKSVSIPAVKESKLANGLTVAVVERKNVPLATVQLLVRNGASVEDTDKAGLANLTAAMLTKGTKTRTATQIAEQMEFLGASIITGAGWNNSAVTVTVTSDKLDQAMAIMADVVLNPSFTQKELDLLKSQTLDGLTFNLKQPGFLATYVASKYSFDEHPAGGTPESITSITTGDVSSFHTKRYRSDMSVLIFTGDISSVQATALAGKFFGGMKRWEGKPGMRAEAGAISSSSSSPAPAFRRILVVDLPDSGQAAVNYLKKIDGIGRRSDSYYPASVLNSLLGGGYSSRLNQEIRIKRGLSYGAGSSFAWRSDRSNFGARTQTKNESAAEVAVLVLAEIERLTSGAIAEAELDPRKSVLTGNFGRNLETTAGLAGALADLYSFGVPSTALNTYVDSVTAVKDAEIRAFSARNLLSGDIIIVGDYAIFKDDLAKRFPNVKIDVVKVAELNMDSPTLRKSDIP